MKRSQSSVAALIRALGFITARQIEAHLPKPAVDPPAEPAEAAPPQRVPRRPSRRRAT